MINLNEFVTQPDSITSFINNLKAGSFSMNWKEILADEEKLVNLHEITFGTLVQLADAAQPATMDKVAPALGKLFILIRHIEIAVSENQTKKLADLTQQFEAALKDAAQVFTQEIIAQILQAAPKNAESFNPTNINPLFALVITLKMLVHADVLLNEEDEEGDEEDYEDECCDDEDDNSGCC